MSTPSPLYDAGGFRRRAVRRDVTAELRRMRTTPAAKPPPRKRPTVKVLNHTPAPAAEPPQEPQVPTVDVAQAMSLTDRLKAAGVASARLERQPHGDTFGLSVDRVDVPRAAELLAAWKAEEDNRG